MTTTPTALPDLTLLQRARLDAEHAEEADASFRRHIAETKAMMLAHKLRRNPLIAQAIAIQTEIDRVDALHTEACDKLSDDYWEARRRVLQGGE